MKNNRVFIFILSLFYCFCSSVAQEYNVLDSLVDITTHDGAHFRGTQIEMSGDTLYKGLAKHDNFLVVRGFWDSDYNEISNIYTRGGFRTYYISSLINDETQLVRIYEDSFTQNCYNNDDPEFIYGLKYTAKGHYWNSIYSFYEDEMLTSSVWNEKGIWGTSRKEDSSAEVGCAWIFVCLLCSLLFRRISKKLPEPYAAWALILIWLIIPTLSVIIYTPEAIFSMTLPFFIIAIFFLIFRHLIGFERKWSLNIYFSIVISVFAIFLGCQVLIRKTKVPMADGTHLELMWKPGTDLVKRSLIKSLVSDLVPVEVSNHDKSYTIYVSRYELRESFYSITTDEMFSWLTLIRRDQPKARISYRGVRAYLRFLKRLTGVSFDLLTMEEWLSLVEDRQISERPSYEYFGVDDETSDENGLVFMTGNLPEMSSDCINVNKHVNADGENLLDVYSGNIVCGFNTVNEFKSNVFSKNDPRRSHGFRLVYRPNDIGHVYYDVIGRKRAGCREDLPESIIMKSLNSWSAELHYRVLDLEFFQEAIVRSLFEEKRIVAYSVEDDKEVAFVDTEPLGSYDFIYHKGYLHVDDNLLN